MPQKRKKMDSTLKRTLQILFPALTGIALFIILITAIIMPFIKEQLFNANREMIRELARTGHSILMDVYMRKKSGAFSPAQAKKSAGKHINRLRYGTANEDYFWIFDETGVLISHPFRRDLVGKNLIELKDRKGNYIFKPLLEGIKKRGFAFNQYYWQRYGNHTNIAPKISYALYFKPWKWVIVTGIYTDELTAKIDRLTHTLNQTIVFIIVLIVLLSIYNTSVSLKNERKIIETHEKLQRTQKIISSKNKELENYLYVVSHDLRSPLVNIQGFSQRLQRQTANLKAIVTDCNLSESKKHNIDSITNNDIPRALDFIFTNTTKMDTLLKGLLQVSRTGRVRITIKRVNMNQLIRSVVKSLSFQLEEIGATVDIGDIPPCYGDKRILNQLFSNILSNAIKYRSPDRQLLLRIEGETLNKKSVYRIQDNGIGIEKRHLEKIWDIFYRVDNQPGIDGEGIGLSLVKRITEKHYGNISISSEKGKGSTITLTLLNVPFDDLPLV